MKSIYVYFVAFCKERLSLFNLDSILAGIVNPNYTPTETGIKNNNKERVIKVAVGSAVGITSLILFIFTILHFRRIQQISTSS